MDVQLFTLFPTALCTVLPSQHPLTSHAVFPHGDAEHMLSRQERKASGPPSGNVHGSMQTHLLAVLADVSVDLVEGTEHVEFTGVQTSLFG